jgi:hypothetical protein
MKKRTERLPLTFEGFLLVFHFPVFYQFCRPNVRKWPDGLTIRVARVPEGQRLDQGATGLDFSYDFATGSEIGAGLLTKGQALDGGGERPGWVKESTSDTVSHIM